MDLVIDIGNTLAKIALFNSENNLVSIEKMKMDNTEILSKILNELHSCEAKNTIEKAIISDVSGNSEDIKKILKNQQIPFVFFNYETPLPIKNNYETSVTLGTDRIAAAVGGAKLFPNKNILIINAGTCITYEIVTQNNDYLGGIISPGIDMRYKSMSQFTGKLPLLFFNENPQTIIGTSTESCMQSGVINGVLNEIEGFISVFKEKFEQLEVISCGGFAEYLANTLKSKIFAHPNLVINGLHDILLFQEKRYI